jgi:hypothetical protein
VIYCVGPNQPTKHGWLLKPTRGRMKLTVPKDTGAGSSPISDALQREIAPVVSQTAQAGRLRQSRLPELKSCHTEHAFEVNLW